MNKDCELPESPRIIVHLVHGTWPDGMMRAGLRRLRKTTRYPAEHGSALWFQTDHPFRKALEKTLVSQGFEPEIRAFIWPGANSFKSRVEAARSLVAHLAEGISKRTRQLVIAHSHGGNVAMLALRLMVQPFDQDTLPGSRLPRKPGEFGTGDPTVDLDGTRFWLPWRRESAKCWALENDRVVALSFEDLRKGAGQIELVTLATPFLRVEAFKPWFNLTVSFICCWVIGFLSLLVHFITRTGFSGVPIYERSMPTAVLYAVFIILSLILWIVGKAAESFPNEMVGRQPFWGKRIRCIRGMADEASMGISMGIVGCNVVRTILMGLVKHLNPVLIQCLTMLAVLPMVLTMVFASDLAPDSSVFLLSDIAGYISGGIVVTMAFASLLQGALGIELALAGLRFVTTVDSSPDSSRELTVVTLASTGIEDKLRHAIYLHPECASETLAGLQIRGVVPLTSA